MSAFLRLLSILCSLVLLASFVMFASDQAGDGSKQTVAQIGANDASEPVPAKAAAPKEKHGAVREAIDDVNDALVGPFKGVVSGDSPWARHISQSLLAFLVFGLGLGFVARYAATKGV